MLLARDRLYHFSLQYPNNPVVNNMLGFLYETEGLYTSAVSTYEQTLKSVDRDSKVFVVLYTKYISSIK